MTRRIEFSPEALGDLIELYDYIAAHDGSLATFPERGTRRDDLRPGLRVPGFERRAVIAMHVAAGRVTILRILYGGRNIDTAFS